MSDISRFKTYDFDEIKILRLYQELKVVALKVKYLHFLKDEAQKKISQSTNEKFINFIGHINTEMNYIEDMKFNEDANRDYLRNMTICSDLDQRAERWLNTYPYFNFSLLDVFEHCKLMKNTKQEIEYLQYVYDKYLAQYHSYESALQRGGMSFIKELKSEIDFRVRKIKVSGAMIDQNTTKKKIRWMGNETQLVFLFDKLMQINLISSHHIYECHQLLAEHFVNKENSEFKPKQLAQSKSNYLLNKEKRPKNSKNIEKIIAEVEIKKD